MTVPGLALLDIFSSENLEKLITWGGYGVLAAIVFAETGLFIGFFLPGDSLLVTAGIVCQKGLLNIWLLNAILIASAIAGDTVGYWIGRKAGKALYSRPDSFFFKKAHLVYTHEFYERHGGKTIVIARFMPIARTFAPVVAGIGEMDYRRFISYNIVGGIAWVTSLTWLGYFIGNKLPTGPVIVVVVFISILPGMIAWVKAKLDARKAASAAPGAAPTQAP